MNSSIQLSNYPCLNPHLSICLCPQNTLLHLAAQTQVETVLPLVVQAYRRAKLFSTAMAARNEEGWNPLHEAIKRSNFENTAFLFNECAESCQEALEPTEQGETKSLENIVDSIRDF